MAVSFNPRARDGRERIVCNMVALLNVSIHAPVMDAKAMYKQLIVSSKFQSTRP